MYTRDSRVWSIIASKPRNSILFHICSETEGTTDRYDRYLQTAVAYASQINEFALFLYYERANTK